MGYARMVTPITRETAGSNFYMLKIRAEARTIYQVDLEHAFERVQICSPQYCGVA